MLYSGLGAIKINRQSRPDSDLKVESSPYYTKGASTGDAIKQIVFLLQSGESIILFPEGWANEGRTQGTIDKPNGVLVAQEGFMLATELAQRASTQKIPIIPTGLVVDKNEKTIRAVFGKPMYYENVDAKQINNYRKAFGEQLMSEIKKLSNI
jgi:1-acyl-sn-glycerol-3-phosphate acyltransferase